MKRRRQWFLLLVALAMAGCAGSQPDAEPAPDEAELVENGGLRVRCIPAAHPNPKITTTVDLELVRVLVERR